ncbi:hypothetical protein J5Y03_16410 [Bacillus sp. RG28]|uniref:YviE n=1 Tax=Gottfriedia endophytica TaxID=2820819 RepID=A0A940NTE7_9BACI|nr:DUF6470 family protein [Gottfriedia endophytica]MBP0726742.1 hypothetical protein [Gottfriedia endophytica]
MQFPQIRLQSTFIKHGLNIEKPIQDIQQPQAELNIKQPPAEMDIEHTPSKLEMDSYEARADLDLKSSRRRSEDAAQEGYQAWLDGLARMSQQGDEMMKVQNNKNAIADIARENGTDPVYDVNIAFLPRPGSFKISYDPGDLKINWNTHKPEIEVTQQKPIINYTPGKVSGYIDTWNSLKIDYTGITIDQKG